MCMCGFVVFGCLKKGLFTNFCSFLGESAFHAWAAQMSCGASRERNNEDGSSAALSGKISE